MTASKQKNNVPEVSTLEKRFWFVKNKTLRTNLAIAFQYIIFLIALTEDTKLPGSVLYSIYKNIIIYTASIVEGILHYILSQQIKNRTIDEKKIMPSENKYRNVKVLYEIQETQENVIGAICGKKIERLKNNTQFQTIIRACRKSKILDKDMYENVEELRKKRNKVHLSGLIEVDDYYDKDTIKIAFRTAKNIIEKAEAILKG